MSTTEPQRPADGPHTGGSPTGPADGIDTGRHAVQRPAPAPPGPPTSDPTTVPSPTAPAEPGPVPAGRTDGREPGTAPGRDPGGDATPARPAGRDEDDARRRDEDDELFPDPHAPRTPHTGTHVLGALLGIVLAPFAVGLLLLGQSRVLRVQVDGWDASLELLGIVLVSAGVLLLVALLVLGVWSAAVPTAAGILVAALGGLQLYAPGIARTTTLDVVGADAWFQVVTQATVAGTSGTTLVAGTLLLAGGLVTALARRHGVRLGAFRERNRTV